MKKFYTNLLAIAATLGLTKAFAEKTLSSDQQADIKAAYDNKNGAPSAGRPKIFMRYFYVNAVTGEKSADILKEVELGASNDPFDESQNGGGGE